MVKLLKRLMRTARNMSEGEYKQFLIKTNPNNPAVLDYMEITAESRPMITGNANFNRSGNEFVFQLKQDHFLSYEELEEKLRKQAYEKMKLYNRKRVVNE